MYAIVETGSVQFRVEEGDTLRIPRMNLNAGEKITLDKVLIVGEGEDSKIGTPYVDGASVTAEVLGEVKGDKIIVFKMKRRTTYRRKTGHRQKYTEIKIDKIIAS